MDDSKDLRDSSSPAPAYAFFPETPREGPGRRLGLPSTSRRKGSGLPAEVPVRRARKAHLVLRAPRGALSIRPRAPSGPRHQAGRTGQSRHNGRGVSLGSRRRVLPLRLWGPSHLASPSAPLPATVRFPLAAPTPRPAASRGKEPQAPPPDQRPTILLLEDNESLTPPPGQRSTVLVSRSDDVLAPSPQKTTILWSPLG